LPGLDCACSPAATVLPWGLAVEPVVHPKPAAVTRLRAHPDKDVYAFVSSASAAAAACMEACRGRCEGFMARGLEAYLRGLQGLGASTNLQLGSVLLLLPLCRAAGVGRVPRVFDEATRAVRECTGPRDAAAYYEVLERFRPAHLGRLEKAPVPGVGEGRPPGLVEVLRYARWDHVHRELLEGYPMARRAYRVIMDSGGPLREEAVLSAILDLLAGHGDTLIAAKWGWAAYKRALQEARLAMARGSPREALEWLDGEWRSRGWNPGSVLDIVAVALGVALAVSQGLLVEG